MWHPASQALGIYREAAQRARLGAAGVLATAVETGAKALLDAGAAEDLDREVRAVLAAGQPRLVERPEGGPIFLEPLSVEPSLIILGGGHVGREVARLAVRTGFRVTLVDDREEWARPDEEAPAVETVCGAMVEYLRDRRTSTGTGPYILIVTRGHAGDLDCLREALGMTAEYVGMIGSRRKVALSFRRLAEEGIPPQVLDQVSAPVGLDLGGRSPAEIAVAVVAEMLALRNGTVRSGRVPRLSWKTRGERT